MNFDSLLHPDLEGWRMAGPGGFRWTEDNALESYGGSGLLWYAEESFDDFVLRVEWRVMHAEDNSGVFVRCPRLDRDPRPAIERGFEIQIDERGIDPEENMSGSALHLTGAVYRRSPVTRHCSKGIGEWNEFVITVLGAEIRVQLNGQPVCSYSYAEGVRSGHIALQNHHDGSAVQFRAVEVMRLN